MYHLDYHPKVAPDFKNKDRFAVGLWPKWRVRFRQIAGWTRSERVRRSFAAYRAITNQSTAWIGDLYRVDGFVLEGNLLPYFCCCSEFGTELTSLADDLCTPLGQLHT
jgi:hypothetical protein